MAPPESYGLCDLSMRWYYLHHLRPRTSKLAQVRFAFYEDAP